MKGIALAGDKGTRLYPNMIAVSEQLRKLGEELKMTDYGKYILSLSEDLL